MILLGTFDVAVFILLLLHCRQLDLNQSGIAMQKGLSIYLIVLFLDIGNLIPKEMLKSFSSPRDKQVAPDAIAKTDWTKCAICQQNKVEPLWCSARIPSTRAMLPIRVKDLGWKYSKVQGSRFHAYADRSLTAR